MSLLDRVVAIRYPLETAWARARTRYLSKVVFVHINKTGGSSIERALGLPFLHCTAVELRELLGERRWNDRFSFSFVRNPWDKVVSHYHYRVQTSQAGLAEDPIEFGEWVLRAYRDREPEFMDQPKMFMSQTSWLDSGDGKVMVDFVGRFERLHEDFGEVCRRVGVDASLPHLKKSSHRDYRDHYSDETRAVIADCFADDLENFKYAF